MPIDHGFKSFPIPGYKRASYLQDDNFDNLVDNWHQYHDKIVLFLGAGASMGAVDKKDRPFPAAPALRNELWKNLMLKPDERAKFDPISMTLTLDHAAAIIEAKGDRPSLVEYVVERFRCSKTLWQHAALPFLKPKAIFTTNYDCLIELGWQTSDGASVAGQLIPVFSNQDGHDKKSIPLYKPHGSIDYPHRPVANGGLVITQFDYFDMLNERQQMLEEFMHTLKDNCVIFIGYSFQDMDIASHLYEIKSKTDTPRWYAVFPRNNPNTRRMYQERYKISQINRRFHDFMADLDDKVNFIPDGWKYNDIVDLIKNDRIAKC